MNMKLLSATLLSTTLILGACGTTEDTSKKVENKTKETTKKAEEKVNEVKGTAQQQAALGKAKTYSEMMHMSKKGIYNQLTSDADKFKPEEAQFAIDNLKADYKKNALKKAESYQKDQNMSVEAIRTQLSSDIEAFTPEEVDYAINNLPK